MHALGLQQKDLAELLGAAPNTITRALATREKSTVRPKIDAYLTRLEEEQAASASGSVTQLPDAARRLAALVGDDRLVDVRIEFIGDGKAQHLVALTVDSKLSREEIEKLIREWREGH